MAKEAKKSKEKAPIFIVRVKPNLSIDDLVAFLNKVTENGQRTFKNFYVALPYNHLKEATVQFASSEIIFGANYLNSIEPGTFTETIAIKMAKNAGAKFVLIGTKEENKFLNVSHSARKEKLSKVLEEELPPILCVGESAEEFRQGKSKDVIADQLVVLKDLNFSQMIVVYEMPFEVLSEYLPSSNELKIAFENCQNAATAALPKELKDALIWTVSLPMDLTGFSQTVEDSPFEGFFFTKSGVFPHILHEEAKELFHIHLLQE